MPPADRSFAIYWSEFSRHAGSRLWLAVALLVATGLLESASLLLLVPLLTSIGLPEGTVAQNPIAQFLQNLGLTASLSLLLVLFTGIKAAQAAVRTWSGLLTTELETGFTTFLRSRFYQAMMQASWLEVTRRRSSDLSQALLQDLPWAGMAAQQVLLLLGVVLVALAQVGVAFILSPTMTLIALAAGAGLALGLRRLRDRAQRLSEQGQASRTELTATVTEHLAGMKLAKSQGRETHHFQHFLATLRSITADTLRLRRIDAVIRIWMELGAVLALGVFVWFAVTVQRVEVTHLIVLAFAFSRLLTHAATLQSLWHGIALALPPFTSAEHLRRELENAAEAPVPAAGAPLPPLRDAVRLENVSFRYAPEAPALRAITLAIPARQIIAICGPSGAGKSTVADLLLGLLSPEAGRVTIDGEELRGDRLHAWRQSVGYVPQESFLFHDTVRANLLWARPEATEGELRNALTIAAAADFVDRLPQGLETVVGDRGVRLSGGERQRIGLARALLRQPELLVLDEATSALDPQHERLVQAALEKLRGELTIVLIAHRLSTVRAADRIIVLETGQVAETGTWEELAARPQGVFRGLLAADRLK